MPRITRRKRPIHPTLPSKPKLTKLAEAYERIGVTEEEVNAAPKISHILRQLPGKCDQAIEFLRGSEDPDARKCLGVYDSVPVSVRKILQFESFCVASGVTTKRMLEVITGACFEQSTAAASLLAKASHPVILKKSIKFAKEPSGWEDRKMLHQREGFAPIPKTQVVNVQGNVNTDNRIQSVAIGELSGINTKMSKIADRFNEQLGVLDVEHKRVSDGDVSDGDDRDGDVDRVPDGAGSGVRSGLSVLDPMRVRRKNIGDVADGEWDDV